MRRRKDPRIHPSPQSSAVFHGIYSVLIATPLAQQLEKARTIQNSKNTLV
jgi:hypothetical protein